MLFESNVFNMINWLIPGVEPRTGMYLQSIPLTQLPSCSMQGPALELTLYFNPFSSSNDGFGVGWKLNLAHIETSNSNERTLILSDGSRYKILSESDTAVVLQYKTGSTFKFIKEGENNYKIINKNGRIETLANNQTSTISSPNGTSLNFKWKDDQSFSVSDSAGNNLVSSTWNQSTHVITNARNTLNLEMHTLDGSKIVVLETVSEGTGSTLQPLYNFTYMQHNGTYLLITAFNATINFSQKENVSYSPLPAPAGMPGTIFATTALTIFLDPSSAKSETITRMYDYNVNNYLGYPVIKNWKTGCDNLEMLANFKFSVTEIFGKSRKRVRRYNKFYLLETDIPLLPRQTPRTPRNGKSTRYIYALTNGENQGIDAQPPAFTLPVIIRQVRHGIDKQRKAVTKYDSNTYSYDSDGNLLQFISSDGTTTRYEYYPPEGASDDNTLLCPPDPNGFINYLKQQLLVPAPPSSLLVKRYQYRYKAIAQRPLVLATLKIFDEVPASGSPSDQFLTQEQFSYEETPGTFSCALTKMQFSKSTVGIDSQGKPVRSVLDTITTLTYTQVSDARTKNGVEISTTVSGFDQTTQITTVRYDANTGTCQSSTDENLLTTSNEYDSLGRLTKQQYPWGPLGTETATDSTIYNASDSTLTTSSTRKQFIRTEKMNGLGNVVSEHYSIKPPENHISNTISFLMMSITYNELGQLKEKTLYDCMEDKSNPIAETTRYEWNIYDQPVRQENSDLSETAYLYDYYNNTVSMNTTPGSSLLCSSYNNQGLLIKEERFDLYLGFLSTTPDQTDTMEYDGFCRLTTHLSDVNEDLRYTYDAFDRITGKQGTISGTCRTEYAPHSQEELVTKVITGAREMGTRSYDGSNRIIRETVNQAESTYDYTNSDVYSKPKKISYLNGRVFSYRYNPALGQILSRDVFASSTATSSAGTRTFSYKAQTGLLAQANAGEGQCIQFFDYDNFDNLIRDDIALKYQFPYGAPRCETKIKPTLRGKPIQVISKIYYGNSGNQYFTIEKNYQYEATNGGLKNIDLHINGQLRSRSKLIRNAFGNVIRIDNYACISGSYFSLLSLHRKFGAYRLLNTAEYTYKNKNTAHTIFSYDLVYNKHNTLEKSSQKFMDTAWDETYFYDRTGFLTDWKIKGNLVFENEYASNIISQQFSQDESGNLKFIRTSAQAGGNISRYYYDLSGSKLSEIVNTDTADPARAGLNYPRETKLSQDAEGHVIQETSETTIKTFSFSGEDNFSSIKIAGDGFDNKIKYYYDANGEIVQI